MPRPRLLQPCLYCHDRGTIRSPVLVFENVPFFFLFNLQYTGYDQQLSAILEISEMNEPACSDMQI